MERTTYSVKRSCARCKGTGQAQFGKKCGVCNGAPSRWFQFFAHELTDADLHSLPPSLRGRAIEDCEEHKTRNRKATRSADWIATHGEPTCDQERNALQAFVDAA